MIEILNYIDERLAQLKKNKPSSLIVSDGEMELYKVKDYILNHLEEILLKYEQ